LLVGYFEFIFKHFLSLLTRI